MNTTEVFPERDVVHNEEPIVFTKPWFARGWVIGMIWASIASGVAVYGYLEDGRAVWFWMILAGILWTITLFKYLKGVRCIKVSGEVVRVYARDIVTPIYEIHFDNMTIVRYLNEIYFIHKARLIDGFSLKRVYWKNSFAYMDLVFDLNATYLLNALKKNGLKGLKNLRVPNTPIQRRDDKGIMGFFNAVTIIYEFIVGLLLWPFYHANRAENITSTIGDKRNNI
ncbi:hypothetical protein BH09BAC1_BH09BAC1_28670 [soil metagenome]